MEYPFDALHAGIESQILNLPAGIPDSRAIRQAKSLPDSVEKFRALGKALSRQLRYREAVAAYTEGLNLEPEHLSLLRLRAGRYLTTLQSDPAIADFEKCLTLGAEKLDCLYRIGLAQYYAGRYEQAMEAFEGCMPLCDDEMGIAVLYWHTLSAVRTEKAPTLLKYYRPDMAVGHHALIAVSLAFPITTLMNAASIWIGVGVNVLIAGYLGQKKQDEANATVTHGLLLAFGIGALLNLMSLLIMKPYFRAFTNNEEIYQLSIAYMSVCSFMQIPNMVHIAIQKMIQATGNMVAPMWFQIAGVVVNFVFDPILIFGIGIFPAMGIRGAAVATVAGYLLSMILAFALLLGKKQKVQVKIKGFHLQKQMIRRIFAFGLPSFIMNALSSFMVTFVNLFLVAYSDTAIAFFGAYFKVQQLIVMTVNGLIQGCLPVMRFNYGAGNSERLHSAFRYGTALVTGMMILGTLAVILFPAQILGLFTASETMRSFGISAMRIMAASYLFCGLSTMISTYFQATEKVGSSMAIQLCRQMLFLVPALWCLDKLFRLNGIWLAFPVAETATLLVALVMMAWHRRKNIS